MEIAVPKQINRELEDKFENYLKKLVTGKKDGGRMGYARLSSLQAADRKGMDLHNFSITEFVDQLKLNKETKFKKLRCKRWQNGSQQQKPSQNQGGITELDYRKTGGFVPGWCKRES
jgi:hypothetical protein